MTSLIAFLRSVAERPCPNGYLDGYGKRECKCDRHAAQRGIEGWESVQGDLYLWRIGETTAEQAMKGIRDAVG